MNSCDTLAVFKTLAEDGENILAKNSDRPLGEPQPLCYYEGTDDKFAVLGSRPYWMDGFEMGANEKGLFIGNEAEGSRMPAETEEGMLGMMMLRIALEKAATAREAIDVIAGLLREHGQNANAHPTLDRRYENSFILVDRDEIWLMETAGREWAAKRFEDFAAVSNCYQICDDFDLCSENLEAVIKEKRWLRPGEKLNFAKAVTKGADRQRNSVPRMRRLKMLATEYTKDNEKLNTDKLKYIFRDHFEGEINSPRFGACYGGFVSICMHALTTEIDSCQTAASMFMTYDSDLGLKFMYAPSIPCASIYIPIYWVRPGKRDMEIPVCMSLGGEKYDPSSLWWTMERLNLLLSMDEERFGLAVRESLHKMELSIEDQRINAEKEARELIKSGNTSGAAKRLNELTAGAAETMLQTCQLLTAVLEMEIKKSGGLYGPRKEFMETYMERVSMPLL
ncbi:MAG: C69 family dipeptidase [Eubacteriales bacterium]|nr:C69 family dipeptidase [Eubacteriales bacterium]